MKKKALTSLLAICLTLSLAACGGASGGGSSAPPESGSDSGSRSAPETLLEESGQSETTEPDDSFIDLEMGDSITVAGLTFTFESQGVTDQLQSESPTAYRSMSGKNGNVLFYVKGTVTNNGDTDYHATRIKDFSRFTENGSRQMLGIYFALDDATGLNTSAEIKAGQTYPFYFVNHASGDWYENEYETFQILFQIPEESQPKPEHGLESGYRINFHK